MVRWRWGRPDGTPRGKETSSRSRHRESGRRGRGRQFLPSSRSRRRARDRHHLCTVGLFGRAHDLVVEDDQGGANDDPLDHVLVAVAERLPHGLLLVRLADDRDARAAARLWRVLLDPAKLDAFRRDQVARVREVEQAPPRRVRVGFRDLEQGLVLLGALGVGQRELVDRVLDPGLLNRPPQVATRFALDMVPGAGAVRVAAAARGRPRAVGREQFRDAEVAGFRRGQEVVLGVEVRVEVRVEDLGGPPVRGHDQGREVVGHGRMVRRREDRVDGCARGEGWSSAS